MIARAAREIIRSDSWEEVVNYDRSGRRSRFGFEKIRRAALRRPARLLVFEPERFGAGPAPGSERGGGGNSGGRRARRAEAAE
jgi:hypothetical protein